MPSNRSWSPRIPQTQIPRGCVCGIESFQEALIQPRRHSPDRVCGSRGTGTAAALISSGLWGLTERPEPHRRCHLLPGSEQEPYPAANIGEYAPRTVREKVRFLTPTAATTDRLSISRWTCVKRRGPQNNSGRSGDPSRAGGKVDRAHSPSAMSRLDLRTFPSVAIPGPPFRRRR